MQFGMLHLFENPIGKSEHTIVHEQLALMRAAEDLGFDSVWPAEHHFSEYGYCASPALSLAAIASETKTLRLGTGVVVLPLNHPLRVAEDFAMLDLMSNGRVDLGVGRGYQPMEFGCYGAIYGMLGNPLTLAAAISQHTRRMKIGTAIMVLSFQHPLRVAEDTALVDVLSGGRVLLGLGRGYQPPEFHGFGVRQEDSRAMFLESFDILTRALSGEKFTYAGKFWQIEEPTEIFPKPIQQPHPPLYFAAISPGTYELAAQKGVSLLRSPQFSDLGTVAEAYAGYRQKMLEYGHDPDTLDQPLSVRTFVAPSDAEAKAETKHVVWFYHLLATLLPGAPGRPAPSSGYENYPRDPALLSQVTVEDVWERGTCFGSPERVTALMKRYMHETGTTSFMTQMRIGGLEHKKVLRSMELFAREVMPALREEEAKLAVGAGEVLASRP